MFRVPVVNLQQQPLMPTTLLRAKCWIASKKATPFWKRGVFCVRLNVVPSANNKQAIALGIDPGSKREAFTVKSASHTYLNVLTECVNWVKDAVEQRRNMRRARRFRKTRYREARFNNRIAKKLAPSTKARWQWKIRMITWLKKMFPITQVVIEDIRAKSKKNCKKWNKSFSPLEAGKHWFYEQIPGVRTRQGYDTKTMRDVLGLKKSNSKLADKFECHNVDSWVLANDIVGGHIKPDNTKILKIVPLQFHRRQLQMFQAVKGNIRKRYGGTMSLGFKRGSLVKHSKYGLCYIGGCMGEGISLHSLSDGKRLTQSAKKSDIKFLSFNNWRGCVVSSTAIKMA